MTTAYRIGAWLSNEPGLTQAQLARRLHVRRSTILRALPSTERVGLRLYEDERGRLFPFASPRGYG